MAKISVIIPVYNVESDIERCARSLFEQTLDDIEYLFIDDCTPDKSIDVLKCVLAEYPHRKSQVIIHRMDQNSGQAKVREWGMKHASGEFIIHCDSDDWNDVTQYEKMYNQAIQDGSDIVFCDYYKVKNKEKQYVSRVLDHLNKFEVIDRMIDNDITINHLWANLVRRDLLSMIKYPDGDQGEDRCIMIQLIYFSTRFSCVHEPLYYYVFNNQSICNNVSLNGVLARSSQMVKNYDMIVSFLKEKNLFKTREKKIYAMQFSARTVLWHHHKHAKIQKLWNEVYPNSIFIILVNPYINAKRKMMHLFMITGLAKLI